MRESWSKQRPVAPGFYWMWKAGKVRVCSVFTLDGKLFTNEGDRLSDPENPFGESLWIGPITPPSPPEPPQ